MDMIDILSLCAVILFLVLFLGRTLQMIIISKTNPFVLGAGKLGFGKLIELLLGAGLVLWVYQSFTIILNLGIQILPALLFDHLIGNELVKYVGLMLMYVGLIIFFLALVSFGKSWRVGIDKKSPGKLVTNGIFKYSRNPIFFFMDIYFAGFALVYTNIFFIAFSIIVILCIHYQILQEEKFLSETYGEEYAKYKKSVRRYV